MAESMEQHTERSSVKIVLPSDWAENEDEIPITPEITTIEICYLPRLKLADNPTWSCNEVLQTPEHILYKWMQNYQIAKKFLLTAYNSPRWDLAPANDDMITSYLQAFSSFIKSIDFQRVT